jgi:hypothetical protein
MEIRYMKRENENGQEERFYPVTHAKAIVYGEDDKAILNNLEAHLDDTNNPHGIDCDTIGAASKDYVDNALAGVSVTLESMGVAATATELNYVDGVTSNIQAQLNNKVNTSDLGDQVTFTLSGTTLTITSK